MHPQVWCEMTSVDGISFLHAVLRGRIEAALPTIFLYHGWASPKKPMLGRRSCLASMGSG